MSNKKEPARRGGSGAEKQRRKQERIEQRRRERAAAALAQRRRQRRQRILRWAGLSAAALFLVWFFVLRQQTPSEIRGHEIAKFSVGRAGNHTSETVTYPMTPPVGGAHAPQAAPCGTHPAKISNETMVHSLEHGAVGLLFDPGVASEEQVRRLEGIVGDYDENVFSAPFPGMETPVAAVSWGEMMRLDEVDEPALRDYIDAFAGAGPEPGQSCPKGIDQPYQFEEATSSPTPAPGEEKTPEETVSPQPEKS